MTLGYILQDSSKEVASLFLNSKKVIIRYSQWLILNKSWVLHGNIFYVYTQVNSLLDVQKHWSKY